MSGSTKLQTPTWFRILAVLALIWNLIGCFMWCMEMFVQEAMIESMTEAQKEWVRSIPHWLYAVYFAAVGFGVLGSIGLLARKSWAVPIFAVSLVLVLIQMLYPTLIAGGLQAMGPESLIMPAIVITLATFLLWLAVLAKRNSWIG